MAMNAAEAHEMLEASLENPELVAQVVPADFTFEVDQTIIDLINDGYLGDIVVADLAVHAGFMDRNAPYTWRNDRDMSGYNIMLMGAISECFMRWIGPPNVGDRPDQDLRSQARRRGRPAKGDDHTRTTSTSCARWHPARWRT